MKKILALLILALLPVMADAGPELPRFTYNEFTTGESLDPGMTQTGVNFTLGRHFKSYYPEIRYGLGALTEIGIKFGATLARMGLENNLGPLVGADLKYQLIKETSDIPLDMAVDFGFDTTFIKGKNASEFTFSTIFSKGYPLTDRGYKFIPYGGLEISSFRGAAVERKETGVHVFGGFEWKLTRKFMVLLEFKAGDENLGGASMRFEY